MNYSIIKIYQQIKMVDSTSHFLKSGTFQKKNVILTGATGGIGSLVLKELLACGANVLALVRDPKLPSYLNDYTKTGQFNYEVIDLEVGPKFTSVMTSAMLKLKGKLDIDLDIFSKDMDYIPYDFRIDKIKKLIENAKVITIATSPYFIEQDYAIKVLKELFNCDIIE